MMDDRLYGLEAYNWKPMMDAATWAEQHRYMPQTHGLFSFAQTPFLRLPTQCLSDIAGTCRVVLKTPAQVGKTTMIENMLGWICEYDRSNTLLILDSLKTGQRMSKNRLRPFLRETCGINGRGDTNQDKSKEVCNIGLETGANLIIGSASSASDLCSTPAKYLCADELDRWTDVLDKEGDPLSLAFQRQMRFRGMALLTSTPTVEDGRINVHYKLGTMETWCAVCHCGCLMPCHYDDIDFTSDIPTIACKSCGEVYTQSQIEKLEHRYSEPQNMHPYADRYGRVCRSFEVFSTLCHSFYSWETLREEERAARALGEEAERSFRNTRLGEVYIPKNETVVVYSADIQRVSVDTYKLDALPREIVFCTAGIDTQDNGFAIEIVGWNIDASCAYGIEWMWIDGKPEKDSKIWNRLTDIIERRRYKREDGKTLGVIYAAQDSGGHYTNAVYAYSLRHTRHIAVKGYTNERADVPFLYDISSQKAKNVGNGSAKVKLHVIGVNAGKDMLLNMMTQTLDGDRCLFWPIDFLCGYDNNYFEQLTAEKRTSTARGVRWELLPGRRNEALDCRIYAMYAAHLLLSQRGAIASIMESEAAVGAKNATVGTIEHTAHTEPVEKPKPDTATNSSGARPPRKFRPL